MGEPYHTLRLMADDMTGALDSAAAFARVFGPLDVGTEAGGTGSLALDTGTRELPFGIATARIVASAAHLAPAKGRLSFFKLDSLLRGHAGPELAALLAVQSFDFVLIAPAMPFQGRITRRGRQHIRVDGEWQPIGEDIARTLSSLGLRVDLGLRVENTRPGQPLMRGITLVDAESEADLDAIVAGGFAATGSVLWVGSGGLAGALARALRSQPTAPPALSGPVLGLIGSHHPVMLTQLKRVASHHVEIPDASETSTRSVADILAKTGAAFVTCTLPPSIPRETARTRIEATFARLITQLPPPGLIFASGGETLRGLLSPLGARSLTILSEIEPGAPVSRIAGGLWPGVDVLSKSGAFGEAGFLEKLLKIVNIHRKAGLS
jgi:D-threonate/D-erythronate kinase